MKAEGEGRADHGRGERHGAERGDDRVKQDLDRQLGKGSFDALTRRGE